MSGRMEVTVATSCSMICNMLATFMILQFGDFRVYHGGEDLNRDPDGRVCLGHDAYCRLSDRNRRCQDFPLHGFRRRGSDKGDYTTKRALENVHCEVYGVRGAVSSFAAFRMNSATSGAIAWASKATWSGGMKPKATTGRRNVGPFSSGLMSRKGEGGCCAPPMIGTPPGPTI